MIKTDINTFNSNLFYRAQKYVSWISVTGDEFAIAEIVEEHIGFTLVSFTGEKFIVGGHETLYVDVMLVEEMI